MCEKCKRGFFWSSKAWYNKSMQYRDIYFGLYYPGGGTDGEMSLQWEKLSSGDVVSLRVYEDAWEVLEAFKDVIDELVKYDNKGLTEEEFVKILLNYGFEDLTEYERK